MINMLLYLIASALLGTALSQRGLSSADKQTILNEHNRLRGSVSPTAANMRRMSWNDDLARVAQNYAENCDFNHNPNRGAQQNTFTSVGENLFVTSGTINYTSAVLNWYNEVQYYTYDSNSCTDVCGHYTQVVWATSDNVGCGAYRCANVQRFGQGVIFVCNYGPAGNFIGRLPYISGSSCSQCPDDLQFCVNRACSNSKTATPDTSDGSDKSGGTKESDTAKSGEKADSSSANMLKPAPVLILLLLVSALWNF